MDTEPVATRIIRIDTRYRHQTRDVASKETAHVLVEEEVESSRGAREPLLIREQKGRAVMSKGHRMFHRRPALDTRDVVTVNVEVVASVDSAGKVLGLATATPEAQPTPAPVSAPASAPVALSVAASVAPSAAASVAPSAASPAVPSVVAAALPSVPAVPPFPSDLKVPPVPSYPWPSGVPVVAATESAVQSATTKPESTPAPLPTSVGTFSSISGYNSTLSSTASSSASSSSNGTSSRTSSASSSTISSASSSITSTPSLTISSSSAASTGLSTVASGTGAVWGGGGFADPAGTATSSPTPTNAPVTNNQSSSPLETPQVVGTVVGSLAGVAILAFLILFLIKRHKQKQRGGALQLTEDDHTDISQPIAQNPARTSFVPPSFLNRFSGVSRSTVDSSGTGERSFQRISGRKLPSAFSEGMTSEQFAAGRGESTLSGSTFYTDDKGFYGGPGVFSKDFGEKSAFDKEVGGTSKSGTVAAEARVRPSPAQTPVIHHADDTPVWGVPQNNRDTLSPPVTPNPDGPTRGTFGRSHPSRDGSMISRSSRFTENV